MAPPNGTNGVIPITVLQKNPPASTPRGPKAQAPRLKLICRRLPPGLTKAEFETILGEEWKVGGGKVDWFSYKKGKISKEYAMPPPPHIIALADYDRVAKPSRPSRAYLHVMQQAYVAALDERVREVVFQDAAKSFQDSALVGPPALEYAPYPKLPGGRRRTDARQGTIDQDPEFKEFLESLTAPIAKPAIPEGENQKEEKVKTTPLIEALREKKANKDKPQGKNKGRGEGKENAMEKKVLVKPGKEAALNGDKNRNLSKAEREKAQKEAVKALTKEAASLRATAGSSTDKTAAAATPAPERKRGNVSIAKSMLQRDLGLGPAPNRRRGTKREVNPVAPETPVQNENTSGKQKAKDAPSAAAPATPASDKTTPASARKERPTRAERRAFKASLTDKSNKPAGEDSKTPNKPTTPAPTILKKPQPAQAQTPNTPKGPAAARAPPTEPAAARSTPVTSQPTPPARPTNPTPLHAAQGAHAPTSTGKHAFLKHANASQGITESLIEEALKLFGAIDKVEIDKRKGFAYVEFASPEGLAKAIAASPVKVAQGAVQVLERKEKVARNRTFVGPPAVARGRGGFAARGRGGRGGARGGAQVGPNAGSVDATQASASAPPPVATPTVTAGGDAAT
jgi:regulator of nonsense transcripts 3